MTRRSRLGRLTPPQLIALVYTVGSLLGALALWSPLARAPGQELGFVTALFTATSALCVTGLTVVDPATTFSAFGEVVLLLLFQIGGLGIISFGTLFALVAGRRVGFGERLRLAQQVNAMEVGGVLPLLRSIVLSTLAIEGIGAALLFTRMGPEEGLARGLYSAVFHAVSAFTNAGFSLYPEGLGRYAADPVVVGTAGVLIVLGSLGFLVLANVWAWRRDPRRQPLLTHTRIVLLMTAVLVAVGTLGIATMEWTNPRTLGELTIGDRLLASVFHSVTPRSGGLSTLDFGAMRPATLLLVIVLMFIGGSPGSTGGGIKTTTFYVLAVSAWSLVRGHGEPTAFRRRIDTDTIVRAAVVTVLSLGLLNLLLVALLLTNPRLGFLDLLFEAVSAFGTVGLSLGATPHLNPAGQLVIVLMMLLGRIGPLTFALALRTPGTRSPVTYPAERNILIG
ncbi:TrkH family potassium uptake protein [Deinococcus pimensis]|uniref:TrkH family potassium uptake protein n=1 Tax=Deinococcus pimensis TaxID=309888 RepID=UPI00048974DE|nr:TrkH family potassium uptake protein [Deinococcus pimensis]